MLTSTWIRLRLLGNTNSSVNVFRELNLSLNDCLRFDLLTWLICSKLARKVWELAIALWWSTFWVAFYGMWEWSLRHLKLVQKRWKNFIVTNKQRTALKTCATKTFLKSLWADQGKEAAGVFAKLCEKSCIKIYSSRSETKSTVAER